MGTYTYIFIRQDISLAQQMVQGIHAALDAGRLFTDNPHYNLVMIGVKDEEELFDVERLLSENDIKFTKFFEPDNDMGYSSICTEALSNRNKRSVLSKFKLWKYNPETAPIEMRTEQEPV